MSTGSVGLEYEKLEDCGMITVMKGGILWISFSSKVPGLMVLGKVMNEANGLCGELSDWVKE